MKKFSIALSVLSLLLVGVLFYLHFSHQEELEKVTVAAQKNAKTNFRIAYFDIDSLQLNYDHYKDAVEQMRQSEKVMSAEMQNMREQYQKAIGKFQRTGPAMTQAEGEAAQRELASLEKKFSNREKQLQQNFQNLQMDLMQELRGEIVAYLEEYNKAKEYAYIFSYQPGELLYYKDTAYDITNEVIKGLNERYKENKKNKKDKKD